MAEIKIEKTIYELLQEIRFELSQMNLTKSGYNQYQNFSYYEEDDIMPPITKLCYEKGIFTKFDIYTDPNDGKEYAYLTAIKGAEKVMQKLPTAEPSGTNPIQQAGSKFTYMSRYSYMKFFNITEPDVVEASDNSKEEEPKVVKATAKQIELIKSLYDEENIAKMIAYYKVEKLEDLSIKDASDAISRKKA